jgi:hypothetical protein
MNKKKFTRILNTILVISVMLVMLAAFVAPAAAGDPYKIYFRVMGIAGTEEEFQETGEYKTIFAEKVTVPMGYTVQCTSPSTGALGCKYSYHINESNHQIRYRHGPNCSQPDETYDMGEITGGTGGATSALAALINASEQGNFTYGVTDAYIDMGQFVYALAGQKDLCYRVWNLSGAHWAPCGCDNFLLGYDNIFATPHTQVLWYRGGTGDFFPLKVDVSPESVAVGDEFTATVSYFEDGKGWLPAASATLYVGNETFTTDDNGTINIFMENEGTYHLSAKKRKGEGTVYINSDNRTTVNVSGGAEAIWWTQTTKDNFSAGTCNQVNVSASPDNILLERGGTVTEDYILDGGTATLGGEHFYNNFTLINGATLNVPVKDPLIIRANYIEVDSTSSINADEKGYAGGIGDTGVQHDGKGMGCGGVGDYNSTTGEAGGGGGGGYGGKGRPGGSGSEAGVSGPAGAKYGGSCYYGDHTFYMGSGGGAGAGDGVGSGGSGGASGGAIMLEADTVIINGHIYARGGSGAQGASNCGSGGGGSGGTIYISGSDITIANGSLSARGGDGADASVKWSSGGGGGGGQIKVFYETCTDSIGHDVKGGYSGAPYGRQASSGSGYKKYQWKQETYYPTLPYFTSGNLTSSIHDTGYSADFGKIRWCATTPPNTSVKFQIATNNDNATWDFKGLNGASNTYYETSNTSIWSGHDGDRYIRYKAFLNTSDVGKTPTVSKVGVTYSELGGVQNVTVTVHNVSFGNVLAGDNTEIHISLTLNNTGDAPATIEAVFKTNVSGVYGLNGTASNIIPGNYFMLGQDGNETALTNTTTKTFISTLPAGATVDYDAILIVPAGKAADDYSGIVELSW